MKITSRGLSAAGRGRDGALKVAQRTVRGVNGDGDGEVEDGGGGVFLCSLSSEAKGRATAFEEKPDPRFL